MTDPFVAGYSSQTVPYGPASGGADGSLLLSSTELNRAEQAPLQPFGRFLLGKYNKYKGSGVSAADIVQFAGSIAIRSCPGGPVYKTVCLLITRPARKSSLSNRVVCQVVGRTDDSTASPEGMLPAAFGANASYDVLTQLWADKGVDARSLAALLGAHTVSQAYTQRRFGIRPGSKSTIFVWWLLVPAHRLSNSSPPRSKP